MACGRHQLPCAGEAVDVPAPGQCLVGDAQAVPVRPFGQPVQLIGCPCVIVEGRRGDVGADQQHGCAEGGHQLELALGATEAASQQVVGDRLVVAERLVQQNAQAQVRGAQSYIGR